MNKSKDKPTLNARQIKFCHEYIKDHNATQAGIRAGYSEKTSYSIGQELLKKPEIAQYVREREAKATEKCEITVEYILTGIQELTTCPTKSVALRAYELLGKHKAMFTEKIEHSGSVISPELENALIEITQIYQKR